MFVLQDLQEQGRVVIATEERFEQLSGGLPVSQVTSASVVEAVKSGYEWRADGSSGTWVLGRKTRQPVLYFDPAALEMAEVREFVRIFRLKPGRSKFDLTVGSVAPFSVAGGEAAGFEIVDLETRSLLQAMYFVSNGVDIPPAHLERRLARITVDADRVPSDWKRVTEGLFQVRWSGGEAPPANAHVAASYQGFWFYIDEADLETKATFSLLMELSRLEVQGKSAEPVFALPLGR